MGLVSITQINNGDDANDVLFNSRISAIVNELNGNIDQDNLATSAVATAKIADSAVSTVKIAANAVTAAKIETQQAFIAPTLSNGWVNYDSLHAQVGYMKDSLGFVHLRGLIKNGTLSAQVFLLPSGYRNTKHLHFASMSTGNFAVVRIDTSGAITISNTASTGYVTLDGITFMADL